MERVAPPEDLLHHDMQNFPGATNPVDLQAQAKAAKAEAAALLKKQKAEEAAVKRATAAPKQKAEPAHDDKAASRLSMKHHKLRMLQARFGDRVSVKLPKTLPSTEEATDELLRQFSAELSSGRVLEVAGTLFIQGVNAAATFNDQHRLWNVELCGPKAHLGNTLVAQQEVWKDMLDEFAILHCEWFMMGPGLRLVGYLMATGAAVHAANTQLAAAPKQDVAERAERFAQDE